MSSSANDRPSAGIIYVATGEGFREEALRSRESALCHHPDLPATLFTDSAHGASRFDEVRLLKNPQHSFIDKIRPLIEAPYEKNLFVDTDTLFLAPVDELFALLDSFELLVCHEPGRNQYPISRVPNCFCELNTGVIAFRRTPAVCKLFADWLKLYVRDLDLNKRNGFKLPHDQVTFTQALFESQVRSYIMPSEYNCRAFTFPTAISGKIKILHARTRGNKNVQLLNTGSGIRIVNLSFREQLQSFLRSLRLRRMARQ